MNEHCAASRSGSEYFGMRTSVISTSRVPCIPSFSALSARRPREAPMTGPLTRASDSLSHSSFSAAGSLLHIASHGFQQYTSWTQDSGLADLWLRSSRCTRSFFVSISPLMSSSLPHFRYTCQTCCGATKILRSRCAPSQHPSSSRSERLHLARLRHAQATRARESSSECPRTLRARLRHIPAWWPVCTSIAKL